VKETVVALKQLSGTFLQIVTKAVLPELLVVQIVENAGDGETLAIKFFLSRDKFEAEQKVYEHRTLHRLLVPASHVCSNQNSEVCSPSSFVFPPHYVTERCEVCLPCCL
jgi:hypothetical protein